MIRARIAVAISILMSVGALAIAIVAFTTTVRDKGDITGRLLQTRMNNEYTGDPVLFPIDDVFVGPNSAGKLRAFYVYPPGYYGHTRGCRVVWDAAAAVAVAGESFGPGLYIDPCGGARFNRDGELVAGPADRSLDRFDTLPAVDGMVVDTRRLWCGPTPGAQQPARESPSPAETPPGAGSATTPGAGARSVTPTLTATATPTPTETASATATPEARKRCDRVSPNTRRP
ncbi:MAG: hypothetical protein HYX50_02345 [Chloroflexi bacterium]|nr:hypothetical protein [Chloroflexota bacterium]